MKKTIHKLLQMIVLLCAMIVIATVTIVSDSFNKVKSPVLEPHYLTASEFAQWEALQNEYETTHFDYMILHQTITLQSKLLNKKHPTEEDKAMIAGYDKSIAEQSGELAKKPSLDELQAQMDLIGSTEPIDNEYARIMVKVKDTGAAAQSMA